MMGGEGKRRMGRHNQSMVYTCIEISQLSALMCIIRVHLMVIFRSVSGTKNCSQLLSLLLNQVQLSVSLQKLL